MSGAGAADGSFTLNIPLVPGLPLSPDSTF
jgi:hypothetical protein